ncbi:MAG TPA: phospholipase D-like domain-containing protein [Polyangiaceae bacterium]
MQRIVQPTRNTWCEAAVERAGILVDGDDYYRAFYAAGQRAQRYLLLAGWQFDTDACLLRGEEARSATLPVTLLKYLDALCERNPELHIYVLAWDFHAVFALEREWMQELRFKWLSSPRLQFLFDDQHAPGGSHHQKFVVIDGQLAFLGGLDLCDHRWDDRHHKVPNPLRVSRGAPHRPFHDVQTYMLGAEAAGKLTELFSARWHAAGGDPLALPSAVNSFEGFALTNSVPFAARRVALSRIDTKGAPDGKLDCREVFWLTVDAIGAARSSIYIETQYFSSKEIAEALIQRLREPSEAGLDVVLVLNKHAETMKEELAVGLAQANVIKQLRAAAQASQHRLGIYYSIPETDASEEPEYATYIHSKLLIVDDRFMTVGSANLTNRSTYLDTELNLTVETQDASDELGRSIAAARRSLIAEHLGIDGMDDTQGLVRQLDEHAVSHAGRLRLHPSPTPEELAILEVIDPAQLPFDPAAPEAQEHDRPLFIAGLSALWERLRSASGASAGSNG